MKGTDEQVEAMRLALVQCVWHLERVVQAVEHDGLGEGGRQNVARMRRVIDAGRAALSEG